MGNNKSRRVAELRKSNKLRSAATEVGTVKPPTTTTINPEILTKLFTNIVERISKLELAMDGIVRMAEAADFRSLALQRVIENELGVESKTVTEYYQQIVIDSFNARSEHDDHMRGLQHVLEREAQPEDHAIINLKLFDRTKELKEQEQVRSKIHLGQSDLFPEVDQAVLGMKVGEQKRFPLSIGGKTDEALVSLLGLREYKALARETQPTQTEGNNATPPNAH